MSLILVGFIFLFCCQGIIAEYIDFKILEFSDLDFNASSARATYSLNGLKHVTLICASDYPIAMLYDYNLKNLGTTYLQGTNQFIHRTIANFLDARSYRYAAHFRSSIQTVLDIQIFVCTNVNNGIPGARTKWIQVVKLPEEKAISVVSGSAPHRPVETNVQLPPDFGSASAEDIDCPILFEVKETKDGAEWHCKNQNGGFVTTNFAYCYSRHDCHNLLRANQVQTSHKCVQRIPDSAPCQPCKKASVEISNLKKFHPQVVICTIGELRQAVTYFYTFGPKGLPQEAKLHFDWDEIDLGEEMLFIKQLKQTNYKINESVTVECEAIQYFFSYGYRIGLEINGTLQLVPEPNPELYKRHPVTNARIFSEIVTLDRIGSGYIYCFAPISNSTEWVNKSIAINVMEPQDYNDYYYYDYEDAYNKNLTNIRSKLAGRRGFPFEVVGGIVGGMLLLVVIVVTAFYVRLRKIQQKLSLLTDEEIKQFREGEEQNKMSETECFTVDKMPYNSSYEIPKAQIKIDKDSILGSGAYGTVTKGFAWIGTELVEIAIKTIRPGVDPCYFKALLSELKVMAYLGNGHENIVHLVAACTENIKNHEIYIGVELCETSLLRAVRNGSNNFRNLVKDGELKQATAGSDYENFAVNQNDRISTIDLMRWSFEIADGMTFLAEKKVIHGDLSLRNVLLTEAKSAKICDFGLARQLVDYNYIKSEQCPLPWKWMAVESLAEMKFSTKSDIWSYGITLWELFTLGHNPYPGLNWTPDFITQLSKGLRMNRPEYATNQIYEIMLQTWENEPKNRPNFADLKTLFSVYLEQVNRQLT